jgi:hypothetical protein
LNAAELPARNPALDRSSLHPQLEKLSAGDDAVLRLGKFSNAVINGTRRQFSMPEMGNRRFVVHAANARRSGRARGAPKRAFVQRKETPARRYRLWL